MHKLTYTNFRPKHTTDLTISSPKPIKSPIAATKPPKTRWWRAMDHLVTSDSQKKGLSDGPLTRALSSILQQQNQQNHFNVNAIVSQYEDQSNEGITNTIIDISDDDSSVSNSSLWANRIFNFLRKQLKFAFN